jgi:NhaP-type Na+/H+ or K+/H+ antiporter
LLVMAYAIGKLAHLPTLLLIFALGICLNNARLIPLPFIAKGTAVRRLNHELRVLKRLTGEGSFLLRAYFFVLFGFSIEAKTLANLGDLAVGGIILAVLLGVRAIYLAMQMRRMPLPETLMAPRGLITILLFYSIPATHALTQVGRGVVLIVILGSTLLMTAGLLFYARSASQPQ